MLRTTAFLLRKIFKIFRNLFPKPNKRIRRVNINRKIRRLGKHLNRKEVQLCLNSLLILRGCKKRPDTFIRCALFFLQILHAVEGNGGNDDKSLKHKLQVGVDAEEG